MTRIVQVEYRRLVSHGQYENTTIGAVAEVEGEERPAVALTRLKEWVDEELQQRVKGAEDLSQQRDEMWRLEQQVRTLRAGLVEMRQRWTVAKTVLETNGLHVASLPELEDPLPF